MILSVFLAKSVLFRKMGQNERFLWCFATDSGEILDKEGLEPFIRLFAMFSFFLLLITFARLKLDFVLQDLGLVCAGDENNSHGGRISNDDRLF